MSKSRHRDGDGIWKDWAMCEIRAKFPHLI